MRLLPSPILRPVGNPLVLRRNQTTTSKGNTVDELLGGQHYRSYWVDSGTSALALAMAQAKLQHSSRAPQVILPAYGCPDLIAAAIHAQVTPVLVDISPNSARFDPAQLEQAINADTVAIVSATLLGMRGDATALRDLIGSRQIMLIEDSAQWVPRNGTQQFFGDAVVLSFGRGKPVNLLGGGALLTRTPLPPALSGPENTSDSLPDRSRFLLKAMIYNTIIHPRIYGVIERLPFLDVGATRYHTLEKTAAINPTSLALLPANLERFRTRDLHIQRKWQQMLGTLAGRQPALVVTDLAQHNGVPEDYALLRYPVAIADPAYRDQVYAALKKQGLGASPMYPLALAQLPGIPRYFVSTGHANASDLARRILTLPTHGDVTDATIAATQAIFENPRHYL